MKNFARRHLSRWFLKTSLLLLFFPTLTKASNFQEFLGINYSNPTELTLIKDMEFIIGDYYFSPSPHITFDGTVTVPDPSSLHNNVVDTGSTSNVNYTNFPYGRIAKRLSSQWVAGVDVTKPFSSDIIYPNDSAVRYSVTDSGMQSWNISPSLAYQFTGVLSNLSIGAGMDAMDYIIDLDSKYPSFPTPTEAFGTGTDLSFTNHATNWAYGWHVGLLYHLFRGTFVGASYYSAISQHFTDGTSSFTGFPTSNTFATTLDLPATSTFSIMQMLSEKWSTQFKVNYSQWDTLQVVELENISGPSPTAFLPMHYKNTWRFELDAHYKMTPKVTLGAMAAYDQTPTNDIDRTLALPGVDRYILGVSAAYQITKAATIEADYGHMFSINAPLNNLNPNDGVTTVGNVNIFGNIFGLQLTVNT